MIQHLYSTSDGIVSRGIEFLTRGRSSHVATYFPNRGKVIESNHIDGVIEMSIEEWHKRYNCIHVVEIDALDEEFVYQRLKPEVGKKYDWSIIWSYPIFLKLSDPDKWGCSELAAYGAKELIWHEDYHEIVPRDLRLLGASSEATSTLIRQNSLHGAK